MKSKRTKLLAMSLFGAAIVVACGGGSDDEAGQLSTFQTSSEISFGTGTAFCPGPAASGVKVGDVAMIGGTAPYQVLNPNTNFISFGPGLSSALPPSPGGNYTVSDRNGQVAVFAFACFEGDISVLDALGRTVSFSVTAASGSGS